MDTSFSSCDNEIGSLQIIFGPMFSGKTTELLRRIRRYSIANKNCLVIKYKADTRYDEECAVTHDLIKTLAFPCSQLSEASKIIDSYDVIGIDEGQFFSDIITFVDKWCNSGKIIVVAALDGTFQRKAFGSVLELVPMAEKVTKLNAVCMICYSTASFTHRMSTETAVEVIGGSDMYVAVCRRCYNDENCTKIALMKSPKKTTTPIKRAYSDMSTGLSPRTLQYPDESILDCISPIKKLAVFD